MENGELPKNAGRIMTLLGLLYLIIICCGIFAHFGVRIPILEEPDTTKQIRLLEEKSFMFRLGMTADLIMVISDLFVGFLFYILLKPVNAHTSLLAALFRWIQAVILATGILMLWKVLPILEVISGGLPPAELGSRAAEAIDILRAHAELYILSGVFFGCSCLFLGWLFYTSRRLPNYLGIFLAVAGCTYILDGFTNILAPRYKSVTEGMVIAGALFAEIYLCIWLLVTGLRGWFFKRSPEQ